jgi:hypothetical protein
MIALARAGTQQTQARNKRSSFLDTVNSLPELNQDVHCTHESDLLQLAACRGYPREIGGTL